MEDICNLLLKLVFESENYTYTTAQWLQNLYLGLIDLNDKNVSGLAVTCLGNLARIRGEIDKSKVIGKLVKNINNDAVRGWIEDAIDDINMYSK